MVQSMLVRTIPRVNTRVCANSQTMRIVSVCPRGLNLRRRTIHTLGGMTYKPNNKRSVGTHGLIVASLNRQPFVHHSSPLTFRSFATKANEEEKSEDKKWTAARVWKVTKETVVHTYHSLKLLASNTRITIGLLKKMSDNHPLTRREQRLLYMTTSDLLRMVPFSFFIIIPGAEALLPIALKLYPGLLPSTFATKEDERKKLVEEFPARFGNRKIVRDHLLHVADKYGLEDDPALDAFVSGEPVNAEMIRSVARVIEHELTIEKLPRTVIIAACKSYGMETRFPVAPFVPINMPNPLLKDKLLRHINNIRWDDAAILREGLEKLTLEELKQDNRERGMQEHTTETNLRKQLQYWTSCSMGSDESGQSDGVNISFLMFMQPRADHFWNSIHNMPQYVIETVMKEKDTPPEVLKQLNLLVSLPKQEVDALVDRLDNVPELTEVQTKLGRLLLRAKANGVPLKRAFALFDFDRDGRLSKEEIKECLEELNISISAKEIAVLFKNYDTDHDGKISLNEFVKVSKDAGVLDGKVDLALKTGEEEDEEVAELEGTDGQIRQRLSILLEEERLVLEEDKKESEELEAKKLAKEQKAKEKEDEKAKEDENVKEIDDAPDATNEQKSTKIEKNSQKTA